MGKITIVLDAPDEIDPSIIEEVFKLKVGKGKFEDKLKEIEQIAKKIGKPKEDPLKVFEETRELRGV